MKPKSERIIIHNLSEVPDSEAVRSVAIIMREPRSLRIVLWHHEENGLDILEKPNKASITFTVQDCPGSRNHVC